LLRAWADAPAFLLSCPGPLRRHHASLLPIAELALPQCLLGGEAQLQAFIAANPAIANRCFFTPLPEAFETAQSLAPLRALCGLAPDGPRPVHLRFGGTRSARVLKDARNGFFLAEDHAAPAITASQHPFASGLALPSLIRRVFAFTPGLTRPHSVDGTAIPLAVLDAEITHADVPTGRQPPPDGGLEVVSLAEFRSASWAAGPVADESAHLRDAMAQSRAHRAPFVILPWNLDHPGSAVPALVERTLRIQDPARPSVQLLILPFNYPGQTGLIRRMVRLIKQNVEHGAAALPGVFLGRLTTLAALPLLRRLAQVAWVDGNDPEHGWTMRRLTACGITPILLASRPVPPTAGHLAVTADDALTIQADTRFGLLHFHAALPSLRAVRDLLPLTRETSEATPRARRREARRALAQSDMAAN
jgi:hypothetical protein